MCIDQRDGETKKTLFRETSAEIEHKCDFLDFTLILINTHFAFFVTRDEM
jgi:hypothetical protein